MRPSRLRTFLTLTATLPFLLQSVAQAYPGEVFQNAAPALPDSSATEKARTTPGHGVSAAGAAEYSIPLPTSPGRNDMAPKLALTYSSSNPARGGVAAGWSLAIPRIELDTSQGRLGTPHYRSTLGGTRLVAVVEPGAPAGVETYRADYDDSYTRYERTVAGDGSTVSWTARTSDGTVYQFGTTPESKDTPSAATTRTLANGTTTSVTEGRWFVTTITDRFGNRMDFHYEKTLGTLLGGTLPNMPVDVTLTSIEYGANTAAGLGHHAKLVFDHFAGMEACTGSVIPIGAKFDYRTGFPIHEGAKRLTSVKLLVAESGTFVERQRLDLGYDMNELACPTGMVHAPLRLLTSVQLVATAPDGSLTIEPPVTFQYGRRERQLDTPVAANATLGSGRQPLSGHTAGGWPAIDSMRLDVDGDGTLDVLDAVPPGPTTDPKYCQATFKPGLSPDSPASAIPVGFDANNHRVLPVMPWAAGNTRHDGYNQGYDQREGCSLAAQFSRADNVTDASQECGFPANYQSYRFMDVTGDGLPDLVTAIDAQRGQYHVENDPALWPPGSHPTFGNAGPCRDDAGLPTPCNTISGAPGYMPNYTAQLNNDWTDPSAGCPTNQCAFPSCDPGIGNCCSESNCKSIGDSPPVGSDQSPAIDICRPGTTDDPTDPSKRCVQSIDSPAFANPNLIWSGPGQVYGDIGNEGKIPVVSQGNANCGQWPEIESGRYPLRVYKNLGGGAFSPTPQVVYSPVPLETDRPTSRLGAGPLAASSSWHGFVDMNGDGILDAVYMKAFFFDESSPGSPPAPDHFQVFLGDGNGDFHGDPSGAPFVWAAPRFTDSSGLPTIRARVSLSGTSPLPGYNETLNPSVRVSGESVTFRDINGDGLPDYIESRHNDASYFPLVRVFYNTGAGFESNVEHPAYDGTYLNPGGIPAAIWTLDETEQFVGNRENNDHMERGWSRATLRGVDLDADGLPDLVKLPGMTPATIHPFAPDAGAEGAHFYANMGDRLVDMGAPAKLQPWFSGLARVTLNWDRQWTVMTDFIDLDGDGLGEIVAPPGAAGSCEWEQNGASGSFYGNCGDSGAPSILSDPKDGQGMRLLSRVDNGKGGAIQFEYQAAKYTTGRVPHPVWVVRKVTASAGVEPDGTLIPSSVTQYAYDGPVYNQDPYGEWGFRGFTKSTVTAPSGAVTETTRDFGTVADRTYYAGVETQVVTREAFPAPIHSIQKLGWTGDTLFGGAVRSVHPRSDETRTCGVAYAYDFAGCAANAPMLYRTHTYVPFSALTGQPAIAYVLDNDSESTAFTLVTGARVTSHLYLGKSDASHYRIVPSEDRRAVYPTGGNLVGRVIHKYDTDLNTETETTTRRDATTWSIARRTFDPQTGNLLTQKRPRFYNLNLATSFTYDSRKLFVTKTTNELGHAVDTTNDLATGALLSSRGPNQKACGAGCTAKEGKSFTIDGLGRVLTETVYVDDPVLGYRPELVGQNTYHDAPAPVPYSSVERRIDFGGTAWTRVDTKVDGIGRTVETAVIEGLVTVPGSPGPIPNVRAKSTFHRDASGNVVVASVPSPGEHDGSRVDHTFTYDALGRQLTAIRPDGQTGSYTSYDGLVVESGDIVGAGSLAGAMAKTRHTSDVYGRLVKTEELTSSGTWATTTYAFDGNDHVRQITSADGAVTTMVSDEMGNRTSVARDGRTWTYAYDTDNNLLSETVPFPAGATAAAYTTTLTYDNLDRVASQVSGSRALSASQLSTFGAGTANFTYDQGDNGLGRLTHVVQPHATTDTTYEARGLPISITQSFSILNNAFHDQRTVATTYNALGKPSLSTHADGASPALPTQIQTAYDFRGLPSSVTWVGHGSLANVTRTDGGLVDARTWTNHRSSTIFDDSGRPLLLRVESILPGQSAYTVRAEQGATYTGSGDVATMSTGLSDNASSVNHLWTLGYDAQHQITSATGPVGYTAAFAYSLGGKVVVANVDASPSADRVHRRNVGYTYGSGPTADRDAPVHLAGPAGTWMDVGYDLAGNATSRTVEGITYTHVYDGADQQREVTGTDGTKEQYWYDAQGNRMLVATYSGGQVQRVRWTLGGTEIWYSSNGTVQKTIANVALDGPVARIEDRTDREFEHHDIRGNLLVALEDDGSLAAGFSYGPFGELLEKMGPANADYLKRYDGKEWDAPTGLSYYGFRYYDERTMSWTQSDPKYRFAPDATGAPRRANLYAFSLNNPLRYVDPDGRDPGSEVVHPVKVSDDDTHETLRKKVDEEYEAAKKRIFWLDSTYTGRDRKDARAEAKRQLDERYGPLLDWLLNAPSQSDSKGDTRTVKALKDGIKKVKARYSAVTESTVSESLELWAVMLDMAHCRREDFTYLPSEGDEYRFYWGSLRGLLSPERYISNECFDGLLRRHPLLQARDAENALHQAGSDNFEMGVRLTFGPLLLDAAKQ